MTSSSSSPQIGKLIRDAREQRGLSIAELATKLRTEPATLQEVENGSMALSMEAIDRIARALESDFSAGEQEVFAPQPMQTTKPAAMHLTIEGGRRLRGAIDCRSSKNAAVALLCASLLNRGRTVLRKIAKIEEVNRICEVLISIGYRITWINETDLELIRPAELDLAAMDVNAARRTRSIIMFFAPLMHSYPEFFLPYAGGCDLGARTIEPHLQVLRHFGLDVVATEGFYHCRAADVHAPKRAVILTERGDTVTENAIMAAAMVPGPVTIRNASPNYMVQDLCFFLQRLGVQIDGIGTTTLVVRGVRDIDVDVEYFPSEDPIEAMSLITAAIVTKSELTIQRAPIEFLEIELAILEEMGLDFSITEEYMADNGRTRLVDITVRPSQLKAPIDKIHPLPFPGLNIDNLPFFAVIAAEAEGQTLIHDWVYENRAIHLLDLAKIGANIQLLDPHRLIITGPTKWRGREVTCPPALRPGVCLLLAMLAAKGESVLRDVYVINRGYEDLPNRLNALGANVQVTTS
ncbi:UDP-N-acetylglucosamine 1-carboxyvinyltransferase [Raineyella antarctica]|uniref:UDP-N-acetylglucosamine 1-carboxyvinyltransferase n=1 Tax=Raineyella antarctica TaxID=1577474 RepID=UPI001FDF8703|nr:UDP-N-acetylglucosamine 1-carboxyvinyltransferase [Raineyella antarctica]